MHQNGSKVDTLEAHPQIQQITLIESHETTRGSILAPLSK
jgi:hypothetical protein